MKKSIFSTFLLFSLTLIGSEEKKAASIRNITYEATDEYEVYSGINADGCIIICTRLLKAPRSIFCHKETALDLDFKMYEYNYSKVSSDFFFMLEYWYKEQQKTNSDAEIHEQ